MSHENQIIGQTPTPEVFYDYDQESTRRGSNGKLAVLVAGALSLVGCGADTVGADTDSDRPDPVVATVEMPVTSPDAPVVVTTEAPQSEISPRREPGIIKLVDIEGLTTDLTSEIDQEAFEAMLAFASKNTAWGFNNDSVEHLELLAGYPSAIEQSVSVLEDINNIKEAGNKRYQYGYRMEALGTYSIDADGSIIADVEELENNRGAVRDEDWMSAGIYTIRFRQVATDVQMPNGSTESALVWRAVEALPR